MLKIPNDAVLLIIDVQKGFDEPVWGKRNNLQAEENIAQLLKRWRETKRPVFHVQHLSLLQNSPLRKTYFGSEIKDIVKPIAGEHLVEKHVNSAFIGTDLEMKLQEYGYDTVVIVGLTTPHCVSTTTRMSGNLGFQTYIVSDATAAFEMIGHNGKKYTSEEIHTITLVTLNEEFATVIRTDELLQTLR